MTTALTDEIAEELRDALHQVCRPVGLNDSDAKLIKYTMNAVYDLGGCVVRLSRGPAGARRAALTTAVAYQLEQIGAPTVALEPSVTHQPLSSGEWTATVWRKVITVSTDPKPVDLAAPLRAIHFICALPLELPKWAPVEKFRQRIESAASLSVHPARELDHWANTELGMSAQSLLDWLRDWCDQCQADLAEAPWALPAGIIHGDAHTGNVLLGDARYGTAGQHDAVLCDLDGICIGPREWDLVPTAHGPARFGRSQADYRAFVEAYGWDITGWPGWPTLRALRELQLVTSVIDRLCGRPAVAAQLGHRLRSLINGHSEATWVRYS